MAQAVPARLDVHFGANPPVADDAPALSPAAVPGDIRLTVYEDLLAIERDWRDFEPHADGTVFQCFDWLATWQRHIGVRNGVRPAIVVGRDGVGPILFLLPLAVRSVGFARELAWLGSELCDYNAPLLAPGFSDRCDRVRFLSLWSDIVHCLQSNPRLRYDFVSLTKMPEIVGAQPNPMLGLRVTINPSGAYLTHLAGDWETFYATKRSSATRRRDRTKRKKLSEFGKLAFVNPADDSEILRTLATLMEQ
jgi:CelD/BcsL family acetyltransferase involved in cellulose biosynthesis